MLLRLPTSLANVLSQFSFYKIAKQMRMNRVFVALAFHRVTEIDWSSSGGSDDFPSYGFVARTVQCYPAERLAPVKRQKVDDSLVVPC